MPTYVALDLETTGLDPEHDEIVEVGAVRAGDGTEEVFHTFVRPRQPLPHRIQRLTGITPGDLAAAPAFGEIAAELERFVGNLPVVGQNFTFDLAFLHRQGIRPPGPTFDTRDLACLLLPGLPDYRLATITAALGIEFPVRHRALADARATAACFDRLIAELRRRPASLLHEAARIASLAGWQMGELFREALHDRQPGPPVTDAAHRFLRRPADPGPPVTPVPAPRPIAPAEVVRLLTEVCAEVMPGFERRPEQERMATRIAEAFARGDHLLIEAGTGVGKSLAYLLPAALHAIQNGRRVVVSTNTINLQEQLVGQEIPLLQQLLARAGPPAPIRACLLKGRRNYLCLLRWATLLSEAELTLDEGRTLARILFWLPSTDTGDRAELNLSRPEDAVWNRLSAQNETCSTSGCPYAADGSCFLVRARKRAESSHVVVINHALLLSDMATDGAILPPYDHLVIDEAHHLEDEATNQFGFTAGEGDVLDFLDSVAGKGRDRAGSLLGRLRDWNRGFAAHLEMPGLARAAESLASATERARQRLPDFWGLLPAFIRDHAGEDSEYDRTLLLDRTARVQPAWSQVETAWEQAELALGDALDALKQTADAIADAGIADGTSDLLYAQATDLLATGRRLLSGLSTAVLGDTSVVAWLSQDRSTGMPTLAWAPLHIGDMLRNGLFDRKESVVLTGATLAAGGDFTYLRGRLGFDSGQEELLGSPFDYSRSTCILVPRDMPEPGQPSYLTALAGALIDMLRASQGRALVLFTSHAALRAAYDAIRGPLEEDDILVLAHRIDGTARQLTNALRQNERAAILGTASFWEGVDVVGEALSLLVIARLPFSVPTDPVFRARSEQFDRPFEEYAVPQAVIRFRQGFGRLIRRKTDRGVMVVLDRRIRSRPYGRAFLNSLPECSVRDLMLRELPGAISEWIGAP